MADFQTIIDKFEAEDVTVIAGSVDSEEKTKEIIQKSGITYPVAYGLDAEVVAAKTGAFYEDNKKFLHATGFLIRPDNSVEVACYSSGPIGRFVARDVLNLVKFYKSKKKS